MLWFPILLVDITPRQPTTFASYPKVSMRALGSLVGSKVLGHGAAASFAVHVTSRSPVRPWMKMILDSARGISERI